MFARSVLVGAAALVVAVAPASAQNNGSLALASTAGGGTSNFSVLGGGFPLASAIYSAPNGDATWTLSGGGPDWLYKTGWYFRGTNHGWYRMGQLVNPNVTVTGDSAVAVWASNGTAGNTFSAQMTVALNRISATQATLTYGMKITNLTAGRLIMRLGHNADFDLPDAAVNPGTNDSVGSVGGSTTHFRFTQPGISSDFVDVNGFDNSGWQLGPGTGASSPANGIRFLFGTSSASPGPVSDANNLAINNSGQDVAAALQWNLDLAAGESRQIYLGYGINTLAIPTPGLGALAGVAGLAALRRRR